MKNVFIVGEDPVTIAIVRRLLLDYTHNLSITDVLPARGGEIKNKITNFNKVALSYPVILLLDLDAYDCAPILKSTILKDITQSPDFIINIAIDEAESWLFADPDNFAAFLKIKSSDIPSCISTKMNGPRAVIEVNSPIKSSLLLTHVLALKSTDERIRTQLGVENPKEKCKGREYNNVIVPFINTSWNVENARLNSDSLNRMILRIETLDAKYQ